MMGGFWSEEAGLFTLLRMTTLIKQVFGFAQNGKTDEADPLLYSG